MKDDGDDDAEKVAIYFLLLFAVQTLS